jgi:hypothetical protein
MGSTSSKATIESWSKMATNITVNQWSSCSNDQQNEQTLNITASNINLNDSSIKQNQKNRVDFECKADISSDTKLKNEIAQKIGQDAAAKTEGLSFFNFANVKANTKIVSDVSTNLNLSQIRTETQSQINKMLLNITASQISLVNKSNITQDQANTMITKSFLKQLNNMEDVKKVANDIEQKAKAEIAGFSAGSCLSSSSLVCCCVLMILMVYMSSQGSNGNG